MTSSYPLPSIAGLDTGATWPTASEYFKYVSIDATTTRASTVMRSMPTRDTRTHASMTIPLSRTRSRTSMRLVPPAARSMGIGTLLSDGYFRVGTADRRRVTALRQCRHSSTILRDIPVSESLCTNRATSGEARAGLSQQCQCQYFGVERPLHCIEARQFDCFARSRTLQHGT